MMRARSFLRIRVLVSLAAVACVVALFPGIHRAPGKTVLDHPRRIAGAGPSFTLLFGSVSSGFRVFDDGGMAIVGLPLAGSMSSANFSIEVGAAPMIFALTLPTTWFVDDDGDAENGCASWADACPDLQTALGLAKSSDQIWVAAGTYKPSDCDGGPCEEIHREETFQLIGGVAIYGGFAGIETSLEERADLFDRTILTGDIGGDDKPAMCMRDGDCDFYGLLCVGGSCILPENNCENSLHVVTARDVEDKDAPVIDGFTIRAGNANIPIFESERGGGLFISNASPTVANCTLTANSTIGHGGGVTVEAAGSPILMNCTFEGNAALIGGGLQCRNLAQGTPAVINCSFVNNSAETQGGGMFNIACSPVVTNCAFKHNTCGVQGGGMNNQGGSEPIVTGCIFESNIGGNGAGIYNHGAPNPTITNCIFLKNATRLGGGFAGGGIMNFASSPTITNCVFAGNSGSAGGGMYNINDSNPMMTNCTFSGNEALEGGGGGMTNDFSSPMLANCTFSDNTAMTNGGGVFNFNDSDPIMDNSILWGDNPDEIFNSAGDDTIAISFSIVEGGLPLGSVDGGGNISSDPIFVDPDGPDNIVGTLDDDLRLSSGSPAIDAADNTAVPADALDLDGDEDTDEPIPFDLDGEARFVDDVLTPDCPQADKNPKLDCGLAPIVDMGAYEFGSDCNGNGSPDACDLDCDAREGQCDPKTCGQSTDCNLNGVPDECEVPPIGPPENDCNDNDVPDDCDIADLTSADCNDNGNPDECELPETCDGLACTNCAPDCNENCVIDTCEIADCPPEDASCRDCNGNDVPDECEIPPLGPPESDCNGNGIPDDCDIQSGVSDDCNVNGVPDSCDIIKDDPDGNGEFSFDLDMDGVPDECISWITKPLDDLWSTDENWLNINNDGVTNVPGDEDPLFNESAVITFPKANVILDINVSIDSLLLGTGATLHINGEGTLGDMIVESGGAILAEGNLLVAHDRVIDASSSSVTIGVGGIYQADPEAVGPVSATLIAGSVTLLGGSAPEEEGALMTLDGSMALASGGDFLLNGCNDKGSGTPPDLNIADNSSLAMGGDFQICGNGAIQHASSEPMGLGGDFDNQSIDPQGFDWLGGGVTMQGVLQAIEAAGEDRGPWPFGLVNNFALGTLTLTTGGVVEVVDTFDNQQDGVVACDEALYVDVLEVPEGATLLTDGCRVYYNTLIGGGLVPDLAVNVLQIQEPGAADLNGDGEVGAFDLAILLASWGPCADCGDCPADLNGDCEVGAFDLAQLLASWGPS